MTPAEASPGVRLGLMSTGGITVAVDVTGVAEVCPVRDISPVLDAAPGLLGAIALRGEPVPLLDMRALAGLAPGAARPGIAVIAVREGRRIALGFDAIEGLIQVPRARIKSYAGRAPSVIAGTFEHGGRIVSLVEPRMLLARGDIPAATATAGGGAAGPVAAARSCLTFDSGGARFALTATRIEATVPRQLIAPHDLAGGAWLGLIRHHGRRIPVMHLNAVIGVGEFADLAEAEIIILRFPDDRLVGFAVGTIRRMRLVAASAERALPPLLLERTSCIAAVIPDGAEPDTFLLDAEALRSEPALLGIAALSDRDTEPPPVRSAAAAGPGAVERERYLVARAGSLVAVPIGQVARIVKVPERVSPLPRAPAWVRGVFRSDGATVPLVDLAHRLGHGPRPAAERARVLLAGSGPSQVGLAVESVDHLEWSSWRSDARGDDRLIAGKVALPRLAARGVLPVLDLAAVADGTNPGRG